MKQPILFATPLWRFSNPLPKGTYDWALKYQKENLDCILTSKNFYGTDAKYLSNPIFTDLAIFLTKLSCLSNRSSFTLER